MAAYYVGQPIYSMIVPNLAFIFEMKKVPRSLTRRIKGGSTCTVSVSFRIPYVCSTPNRLLITWVYESRGRL